MLSVATPKEYHQRPWGYPQAAGIVLCLIAWMVWGVFIIRPVQAQVGFQVTPATDVFTNESNPPASAPPLVVGLPTTFVTETNQVFVQPSISQPVQEQVAFAPYQGEILRPSADLSLGSASGFQGTIPTSPVQEILPPPIDPLGVVPQTTFGPQLQEPIVPLFDDLVSSVAIPPGRWLPRSQSEYGLGVERLPFGLFDIEPAQPSNNFRTRINIANNMHFPDRAEYFWARTVNGGGPPLGESKIDYQELRLRMEMGAKKFSTSLEVPFRATSPELNANHAGPSDLQMGVKTVMLEGDTWILTQYFGTRFATGSSSAGLGTGKVGLEPGVLFRNKMYEKTWMHGELKFWFPIGANPEHGGQVLKIASGINTVWWENERRAWIPSIELNSYSVLNGMTRDSSQVLRPIDGDFILNVTPGVHYAMDRKGDFGLFELGTGLSVGVSQERFADTQWMFDLRWFW